MLTHLSPAELNFLPCISFQGCESNLTKLIEKYWLIIVLAAIIIIFVFIINDNDFKKNEIQDQSSFINDLESNAEDHHAIDQSIIVDVKGEVNKPGVYEIDSYSRVINVIELAGGFTNNADELYVNLAQKVQDEMVIIVPKIGESSSNHSESSKIRI